MFRFVLGVALATGAVFAQDNKALIDALIRKGILTNEEAEQITAELRTPKPAGNVATAGGKFLNKLALSGRVQIQYAGLGTDIDGAADPAATNHLFLRRIYVGAKADLARNWSGTFNYDFAGSTFDAAFISWKHSDALVVDVGLRKVPFAWDEFYTSSDIRAIERSPVTRYFVESNNGRRLGAGSYRIGLYASGSRPSGLFYSFAITNPERDESSAGASGIGDRTNNTQAFWANAGFTQKFESGSYRIGASAGFLPDQGGRNVGSGDDLWVYGVYGEVQTGSLFVRAEYLWSENEHGASASRDAESSGFYIMPTYRVGNAEAVFRYSYVDSDGRGIDLSDGVRSAPGGGSMEKLSEWFVGGNYYFNENDTKLQLGYIHAATKGRLGAGNARATSDGVRSQLQVNF